MKRPPGLIAIVVYKGFVAVFIAFAALAIFFSWKNYSELSDFAESLSLAGKRGIIYLVVEKLSNINPRTLQFTAIAASIYAVVTAAEAVGLWYERIWAHWLIIGTVAISIPLEIYELYEKISIVKIIAFILNLAILWYLLLKFPKKPHKISKE